ncbi:SdpI family protein [Cereibacter sphaeroides]|nr:SdpI family protein [Cereibacter sphaeroides]
MRLLRSYGSIAEERESPDTRAFEALWRAFNDETTCADWFAICFYSVGIPLARKLVPPNRLYGFRLAQAFESETSWYRTNATTGYALIAAGLVACFVSLFVVNMFTDLRQQNLYAAIALLQSALAILALIFVFIRVS